MVKIGRKGYDKSIICDGMVAIGGGPFTFHFTHSLLENE